ncbi:MAG: PQQ-binding-like beta-propeller repeat protein [Sedimentisphaerales bacterium]|nr:PQQ-binding-like beta-propeller repeat protein [Sedimentisphaerales bacterium]
MTRKGIVFSVIGLVVILLVVFVFTQRKIGQLPSANNVTDFPPYEEVLRNWPNFRGPGSNGHAINANPPLNCNVEDGNNILWKTEIPKPGMNSPVVWDDKLFLTGADESSRQIYCFDTNTGNILWEHDVVNIPGSPSEKDIPEVMEDTTLAAPTMITDGRYAAAIFATGDLVCVNMQGKRVWAKNLGIPDNTYGYASSLISYENLLFVQYDQKSNSKLFAFDISSGNPAWQVTRTEISWSSPILIDNNGRMELILTNCESVDSYDPETGQLLWHVKCLSGEVASSAAYANGIVFVGNEYSIASAIDISNHSTEPKIIWQWDEILPNASSLLANDDYLIIPSSYGIVDCLNVKNGEVFWEHEFDDGFYSSPILVNDRVYIIELSGVMRVFKMDQKFELLGTSALGERIYATPAFVGGRIYIRGMKNLFCIGQKE